MGSIGRRHLRLVKELRPELNVIAVRSGIGKKVEEEKLVNVVLHSLVKAMDYGIEAAIIATPAVYHIQQAIELMNRGIHLLIEKPLSHSLDGVNKLLSIQKRSNSIGLLGYCFHYSSAAQKFKKMINSKKIGKILNVQVDCGSYLPDWLKDQDYRQSVSAKSDLGGGVLLELSHELDYIRWFFGDMKSVLANIQNSGTLNINVEDSVDMIFDTKEGLPISVHLDFNTRNTRRKCLAVCSNGNLTWDAIHNKIIWQPSDGIEEVKMYENDRDYIYKEQLKHFFGCIEKGEQPLVSLNDGLAVLNMIESAKKSHSLGKKVAIG